jgi:hypothetical protein
MGFEQISGAWDFSHLAGNIYAGDIQIFTSNSIPPATGGQLKWTKPRNVTMCFMITVSGACGGGGGRSGASTTARGGGGGGCSGSIGKLLLPACFLPDVLSVIVGKGGAGGAANTAGTIGTSSTIFTGNSTGIPNIIITSQGNNQTASGAGTITGGGAGGILGAAPTANTIGAGNTWSIFGGLVGITGSAGGAHTGAVGIDVTAVWNTIAIGAGAGGAGVNTVNTGFAGGNISLQAALDFAEGSIGPASNIVPGGAAGSAAAAGDGSPGIQLWKPFYMTGGGGGGSSDGSNGGNGGRGGIGCGGGGGGAGVTGGRGGDGGDGFVIIISW